MRSESVRMDAGRPPDNSATLDGSPASNGTVASVETATSVETAKVVELLRAEVARLQSDCDTLRWAVCHDELTGLPNRRWFSTLAPARLRAGSLAAVLLLDLNGFKPINDAYGHEAGDRVLQIVARRLDACVDNGLVARLGGDEFVGVLTRPASDTIGAAWWVPTVTALLAAIASPMTVAGRRMSVTGSIGITDVDDAVPIGDLMHRADMAMYEAKIHGLGYAAWDQEMASVTRMPAWASQRFAAKTANVAPVAARCDEPVSGAPTIDPYQRDPADVLPAGSYQRRDPVWVYRHGAWHPGVVESASRRAVMATYRRNAGAGTVVDTMGAECVLKRVGNDPQLDRLHAANAADLLRESA